MASRILVISTNTEVAPQPVLPVGAAWVAESLHRAGFAVRLLDLCFERDPVRRVEEVVGDFAPDGIGISLRNLDNCDFLSPRSYLLWHREIVDKVRKVTDAPILLGGSGVSVMPREVLCFLDLHHAVVGEGEEAAVSFFRCSTVEERRRVPGVLSREGTVWTHVDHASSWVMPRPHRWIDTRRYLAYEPVMPIQGKRGCANRCLYCTYGAIEGRSWRLRPPDAVVEELRMVMAETSVREFEFVDSVFNEPEGYVETLLEEVIRSGIKVRLHASSLSPGTLTSSQVALMERAGFVSVVVSPDSASDPVLTALMKGCTGADLERAARLLSASSLQTLWCFLLGGPRENSNTVRETIRFINRRIPRVHRIFLTTGIRVFPGTGLHHTASEEGCLDPEDPLLMPAFYFTPDLTPEEMRRLLTHGISGIDRCIFLSDTRLAPVSSFRRLGSALKIPTPFWRYAGPMNRIMARRRVLHRPW